MSIRESEGPAEGRREAVPLTSARRGVSRNRAAKRELASLCEAAASRERLRCRASRRRGRGGPRRSSRSRRGARRSRGCGGRWRRVRRRGAGGREAVDAGLGDALWARAGDHELFVGASSRRLRRRAGELRCLAQRVAGLGAAAGAAQGGADATGLAPEPASADGERRVARPPRTGSQLSSSAGEVQPGAREPQSRLAPAVRCAWNSASTSARRAASRRPSSASAVASVAGRDAEGLIQPAPVLHCSSWRSSSAIASCRAAAASRTRPRTALNRRWEAFWRVVRSICAQSRDARRGDERQRLALGRRAGATDAVHVGLGRRAARRSSRRAPMRSTSSPRAATSVATSTSSWHRAQVGRRLLALGPGRRRRRCTRRRCRARPARSPTSSAVLHGCGRTRSRRRVLGHGEHAGERTGLVAGRADHGVASGATLATVAPGARPCISTGRFRCCWRPGGWAGASSRRTGRPDAPWARPTACCRRPRRSPCGASRRPRRARRSGRRRSSACRARGGRGRGRGCRRRPGRRGPARALRAVGRAAVELHDAEACRWRAEEDSMASATCMASSRVGVRMSACRAWTAGSIPRRAAAGRTRRVLPVPVWARPTMSRPASSAGWSRSGSGLAR